jgi:membrane peptidoglycan carboxypeptidase
LIRGGIRLGILYLVVWGICIYWDGGGAFYSRLVNEIRWVLPFSSKVDLFLGFLGAACFCSLCGFWLWVYTAKLDRGKGSIQPPLPNQPLRYFFRLRPRRSTGAIVCGLFILVFGLQSLQDLRTLPLSSEPFSFVYNFPWLSNVDSKTTSWVVYGILHLGVVISCWVLLVVLNFKAKRTKAADGGNLFVQYQARQQPVIKVFTVAVLLAHFPLAGITAMTHSHPFHGLVVLCSLLSLLLAAFLGQVISLKMAMWQDRWLATIHEKSNFKGRSSEEYQIWASALAFLAAKKPEDIRDNSTTSKSGSKKHGAALKFRKKKQGKKSENDYLSDKLLAKAKAYLENNKVRKGRKLLEKLVSIEDHRISQHARDLLQANPPEQPNRHAIFKVARVSIVTFLAVGVILSFGLAIQWSTLPEANETRKLAQSAHIHVKKKSTQGQSKLYLFGNRYDYSMNTSLQNISEDFQHAVLASEDHRFYEHGSPYILAKFAQAGVLCVLKKINPLSNGACPGNSTVTQQLARNLFLSEERSVTRKVSELLWALKMEMGLRKDEILSYYMNRIYLGNGNYGVEMAARDYFGKSASGLSTNEAAYLAAAIKRPSWNWYQDKKGADKRARLILALMKKHGYAEPVDVLPKKFNPRRGYRNLHKPYLGHLWQWSKSEVEPIMKSLPDGNYKVLTTLNAEVEIYAEKALEKEIARLKKLGKPVSQGAVVVMRPDGELLAMVGGTGDKGRYFNRAKRTVGLLPRPPASTFKPFIYLAALESGLEPTTLINAQSVSIPMPGSAKAYQPQNHDGKNYGKVSLRDGLVYSINTAAVRLLYKQVGYSKLFNTVKRLGIQTDTLDKQWGLALGQSGVSLVEMVSAYCVFANGGKEVKPYSVNTITSESGKTIWRRSEEKKKRLFKATHISDMNSMLQDVVRFGTGKRAANGVSKDIEVAGKTGTGDDFVDAWFIGYTSDLVIGVWIGNDKPLQMSGVYGGNSSAIVFNDILKKVTFYTDVAKKKSSLP